MNLKIFKRGLLTGIFLQLAIGPVFFFIINLTLQRTIYDGFAGVLAVTLVDYFYILLSILGIGKLLEKNKIKKVFGIISSVILIFFGGLIIRNMMIKGITLSVEINSGSVIASFFSVLILTIFNPMTIIFFTGLFTAKAIENKYTKKQLRIFGLSVGLATFIFMGISVILFAFLKEAIPLAAIQILNLIVGAVLIIYGIIRIVKMIK